jgi:hypothetical protein
VDLDQGCAKLNFKKRNGGSGKAEELIKGGKRESGKFCRVRKAGSGKPKLAEHAGMRKWDGTQPWFGSDMPGIEVARILLENDLSSHSFFGELLFG